MRLSTGLGHADTLGQQRKKHGNEKDADDPLEDNHVGCSPLFTVALHASDRACEWPRVCRKAAQSVRRCSHLGLSIGRSGEIRTPDTLLPKQWSQGGNVKDRGKDSALSTIARTIPKLSTTNALGPL